MPQGERLTAESHNKHHEYTYKHESQLDKAARPLARKALLGKVIEESQDLNLHAECFARARECKRYHAPSPEHWTQGT